MFYIDNIAAGAAWLAMAVGFLSFATRGKNNATESDTENNSDDNSDLHDMAILIADVAIASLKNIGRTVPPSDREIQSLEDKLNKFLDVMPLEDLERQDIADEFERLRERTRRSAGGRALMRSSRL